MVAIRRVALILSALSHAAPALAQRVSLQGSMGRSSSDMNWNSSNGESASANQTRAAFYAAVGVRGRIARRFSLAADVQVAPKGFNRTTPTMHSTFLEVPLLLLWEGSGAAAPTQWYLGAGLAPGRRLHCRRFFSGTAGPHEDDCGMASYGPLDLAPFRRWDVSQEWRVGVRRAVGQGRMVASVRLSSSLTDQEPGPESRKVTTHHFATGWLLGYEVSLK